MIYQIKKINEWHFTVKDDPIGYIVLTHLHVEHGLDYLIFKNCKNQKYILKDHRTYSFAVKLELCHEMKLIPDFLYENIKALNSLRNRMVHNLEIDYKCLKLFFTATSGKKMFPIGDFLNDNNDAKGIQLMISNLGLKTITALNSLIASKYLTKDNSA
jgi:hypothetical protein